MTAYGPGLPTWRYVFRTESLARPKGFEPLASASGGQRSIQLSYGRIAAAMIRRGTGGRPVTRVPPEQAIARGLPVRIMARDGPMPYTRRPVRGARDPLRARAAAGPDLLEDESG
jgi:hypothetical protein